MPEGVNVALEGAFYGEIFKRREKWIRWEDMYCACLGSERRIVEVRMR